MSPLFDILISHRQVAGPINGPTVGPLGGGIRVYCSCKWTSWQYLSADEQMAEHLEGLIQAAGYTQVPPGARVFMPTDEDNVEVF